VASINEVVCDISVVLGSAIMPIHQMLRMSRGAIIELEATEDDEVTILANNLPVAKGTVSVNGNRIGVAITRILSRPGAEAKS
jgi:flagellar motor switch protein FliN/FliY